MSAIVRINNLKVRIESQDKQLAALHAELATSQTAYLALRAELAAANKAVDEARRIFQTQDDEIASVEWLTAHPAQKESNDERD
jgi:hypothetical protein